jgi:hypothetical protein
VKPYVWIRERYSPQIGLVRILQYEFPIPGTYTTKEFIEAVREVAQSIPRNKSPIHNRPILIKAKVMEYYQYAVEILKELDPPIIGVYNPTIGKYIIVYVGSSWRDLVGTNLGGTIENPEDD